MLWGGQGWTQINKFSHTNLDSVDFSPNEKFLVTSLLPEKTKENEKDVIYPISIFFLFFEIIYN